MTHQEFVDGYHSGRLRARIDRDAAARFVSGRAMLPLVMLPVFGLAVALAIVGYVIAGAALFAAALVVRFLVRRSSDGFLLWRALRDADFYSQVVAAQVLTVERRDR